MTVVLEAIGLIKRFPKVTAVDGISLRIREGTCFGLLGPNGAGKTTTVEMLEGLTRPTAGEILYKGAAPGREFKNEIGILFQSTALQDFLTTREVLELFASFYPRPLPVEELAEMCTLGEFLDRDNRLLSGGQRQRLYVALALVGDPTLIFLDEPTTGLDPQARQNFWRLIETIKAQSKTIVLTTHYMEEAHALCEDIAIMDQGRIIAQGNPDGLLREHYQGVNLELPVENFAPPEDFPWSWQRHGHSLSVKTCAVNDVIAYFMERDVSLEGMRVKTPTLEDLFLDLTGRELRN